MDPERWRRIESVYHSALRRNPKDRSAYLAAACAEDRDLRDEVASLLAQDDSTLLLDESTQDLPLRGSRSLPALTPGETLGHYRIESVLGQGGMGRVYRAVDTRLGRCVAVKISADEFSQRFEREARVISALNHPHICTLHDVGRLPTGAAYMVTELVEGQTLRDWLGDSPGTEKKLEAARQILEALRAAHGAGIVHRDLKPANIMVRFDGYIKVLDFGLAKRIFGVAKSAETVSMESSVPGQIIGTVAYMSPEQILGHELDSRSDLFAFGIILYEMIAGLHPWPHKLANETLHAILRDPVPTLDSVWAGIVNKLLRKNREERYGSADDVLNAIANPVLAPGKPGLTRLIVLPFRVLRAHESSDFLSLSLPDAITTSLAAVESLVVRSTMLAAAFASDEPDPATIAEKARVDAILTGSILPDGENLRVNAQLVRAPDGALLWSNTSRGSLRDIFQLQDSLVGEIVRSLALPLTAREERALKHDAPASALGYEFYLRANQLIAAGYNAQNMALARDLYLQSVDADPQYAPAWACLARAHRYVGKFLGDTATNNKRAEDAFQKAFALNPDLAIAHNFYTAHETDSGRSLDALGRLLKRAHTHQNDPNLFIGLVQACRYCGLLDASLAAHERAKLLDPNARTSVAYTYMHMGEYQKALDHCPAPSDFFVVGPALDALGRGGEAIAIAREFEKTMQEPYKTWFASARATLEGDYATAVNGYGRVATLQDPEAYFWQACYRAKAKACGPALECLSKALDGGYQCHRALVHSLWLEPLRSEAGYNDLVNRAVEMSAQTRRVFLENGGDRIFGVS